MDDDVTLLRYRYPDGRLQAAFPLRRIDETTDRLVGWLPVGSEIAYWSTETGDDPRKVPLAERFRQCLGYSRRTWTGGSVLRVIPRDEPWQVLHFWDEGGTFTGWYVNLESGKQRDHLGVTSVDWHLDLLISPEYVVTWKDEDEAEAAVRTEYLREQDLAAARETGAAIAAEPQRFIDAIGHWQGFRPGEELRRPLSLPDGWDGPTSG
jgi:hypothetical protein